MKKSFFKFLLFTITLILNGCVAYQEEFQTLKIKVINLEAIVNKQNQKYEEMEKRLNVIDKKITSLESKISKDVLVDIKTQILSDLEDIKYQQALLSSQLEDLKFSKEEQDKEFTDRLNNLFTQVQALQLRIKEIEKKLGITPKVVSNETTVVSNETISSNETAILSTNATNATNTTITQVEKSLTEVELYEKAYSSYQQGDFKNARKLFEEYIEKFPKGKWIGQAYFWIGESYFKEKKYEEAILSYQKLIELQGWHPLKPTAMFKQAQAFKALGDIEAYKILLKKVINQYPNSKEAEKAKKLLRK